LNKIVLFILFFCITSSAQNFKCGFDVEFSWIRISDANGMGMLGVSQSPISGHLNLGYNVNESISVQIKIGRSIVTEFLGWEYGILGKYKLFKPLYISFGILNHRNEGDIYSNQLAVSSPSILMIQSGAGIDIVDFFSLGFDYYIPTIKQVIVWRGFGVREPQTFEKMIRLGFNFGWEL